MLISYFATLEKQKSAELLGLTSNDFAEPYFFLIFGIGRLRKIFGFLLKWKTANMLMMSPTT